MEYAVFDWDYTVRDGYTLFHWIDYICNKGIISSDLKMDLADMQSRYDCGEISHDEYADMAYIRYARAMRGISEDALHDDLLKFIENDEIYFFPFTEALFQQMFRHKILPVVITGAPLPILRQYKERFHLHSIYAFEAETDAGTYTGRVRRNCGFNKEQTVRELAARYNAPPLFGFGDSSSDIPLLQAARHAVCINTHGCLRSPKEITYLPNTASPEELSGILTAMLDT